MGRERAVTLIGLVLIACGTAAWVLVPRSPARGRDCGVPALDAMRDNAGMNARVAGIMGGQDAERFFCTQDGRQTLAEAAVGTVVAATVLTGVASFVALRTSTAEDPCVRKLE